MTKEEAIKKAAKIFLDTDVDYVSLLNTGCEYDIAEDLMDVMFKSQIGYRVIDTLRREDMKTYLGHNNNEL